MRITFVTQRYWPAVGGVEKYIHRLIQALQSMGHHVCVVTGAHDPQLPDRDVHEGVEIYRFPARRSPLRCWWRLLRYQPVFRDADVIHVSDTVMLEYFYRMAAWLLPHKPLFLTRHGMSYIHPVPALEKQRARRTLQLVDGVIHDGCFIEKWLGVPADCVPDQGLYPEADALTPVPEPPTNSAVFVGRLDADSGIRIYVEAVRALRAQHGLELSLDVYGDGLLRPELEAQAQHESLPIRFHGWQADAQERIVDGRFAFVAGRMAMQEAMARRRLVVAAYVDPLKRDYVCGEPFSPYLLAGGDPETIAALTARYARDHAARAALVERAYTHACTLSWRRTASEYLKLWQTAPRRKSRMSSLRERTSLAWTLRREARAPQVPVGA